MPLTAPTTPLDSANALWPVVRRAAQRRIRVAFVVEQVLGHRTHYQNLQQWVARDPEIDPVWIPVHPWARDTWQRLPIVRNNWTLLSSLRSRSLIRQSLKSGPLDLIFFHTQVMTLASAGLMKRIPTVVSLDSTPISMDSLDAGYGSRRRIRSIEILKDYANRSVFQQAKHMVCWSRWAADSLGSDYGIAPDKITVIPPGADPEAWAACQVEKRTGGPVRLLFIGGDFVRKGGDLLLRAFRDGLHQHCELDIVTSAELPDAQTIPGVRIHRGVQPNSPELIELYRSADIFVLPTRGDCLPMVLLEASLAGLPSVTANIAGIPEIVEHGVSGFLAPVDDAAVFAARIRELVESPVLRQQMGHSARKNAMLRFSGSKNYPALLEQLKQCASVRSN